MSIPKNVDRQMGKECHPPSPPRPVSPMPVKSGTPVPDQDPAGETDQGKGPPLQSTLPLSQACLGRNGIHQIRLAGCCAGKVWNIGCVVRDGDCFSLVVGGSTSGTTSTTWSSLFCQSGKSVLVRSTLHALDTLSVRWMD